MSADLDNADIRRKDTGDSFEPEADVGSFNYYAIAAKGRIEHGCLSKTVR